MPHQVGTIDGVGLDSRLEINGLVNECLGWRLVWRLG